jgi:hypothetical protein
MQSVTHPARHRLSQPHHDAPSGFFITMHAAKDKHGTVACPLFMQNDSAPLDGPAAFCPEFRMAVDVGERVTFPAGP